MFNRGMHSAIQHSAAKPAKPQPNLAKRLECVQLAAALDQRWMAGRFGALDCPGTFDSGSKLRALQTLRAGQ